MKNRKIRIFKDDGSTKIKNFFYSSVPPTQINVILPHIYGKYESYALMADGSINNDLSLEPPGYYSSVSEYTHGSKSAVINDQPYIFGGYNDRQRVRKIL